MGYVRPLEGQHGSLCSKGKAIRMIFNQTAVLLTLRAQTLKNRPTCETKLGQLFIQH